VALWSLSLPELSIRTKQFNTVQGKIDKIQVRKCLSIGLNTTQKTFPLRESLKNYTTSFVKIGKISCKGKMFPIPL